MHSNEQLIRLSKVPATVERITGDRPHHRWRLRGCKGVKLKTAFAGGHCRTTERWLREFFADITAAVNGATEDTSTESPDRAAAGHKRPEGRRDGK